jgi:hypothetical protein
MTDFRTPARRLLGALLLASALPGPATAQTPSAEPEPEARAEAAPAGELLVELNKLEPVEGACRIYLLLRNTTGRSFEGLQLELVSFDGDGIISQRVAVDLAPLPAEKTLVKLFDVPETPCDSVSRLLLNEVLDCRAEGTPIEGCLGLLEPTSRAEVEFWK